MEEVGGRLAESERCRTSDTHTPPVNIASLPFANYWIKTTWMYTRIMFSWRVSSELSECKWTLALMTVHWRLERLRTIQKSIKCFRCEFSRRRLKRKRFYLNQNFSSETNGCTKILNERIFEHWIQPLKSICSTQNRCIFATHALFPRSTLCLFARTTIAWKVRGNS